jgi:outer membrane protein assembly factor BamB
MRVLIGLLAASAILAQPPAARKSRPANASSSASAAPAITPADIWPQFRGNPTLTGVSASTLPAELKVRWTFDVGDVIESSAAIVGDAVYVGAGNGFVYSIGLNDGKLRWKQKVADMIGESSPTVVGGVLYIGDMEGGIHALNASDGTVKWKFAAGNEIKASPVVVDGKVIAGSYDGILYALDAADGKLAWKFKTNGPVHATAAVSAGMTYVSGCDGVLRAIRIKDGQQVFEIKTGSYTGASPVLVGDGIYFGTYNNEVFGFNVKTRRMLWRYENKDRQFPFQSSAAVADGKVILGGRDKTVHALDLRTGKELWSFMTRARIDSSPAVAGDRVYIGSNDGRLYVLDLKTGKKVADFEVGSALSASPAVAQGKLVIGSQDGKIYCLGG